MCCSTRSATISAFPTRTSRRSRRMWLESPYDADHCTYAPELETKRQSSARRAVAVKAGLAKIPQETNMEKFTGLESVAAPRKIVNFGPDRINTKQNLT